MTSCHCVPPPFPTTPAADKTLTAAAVLRSVKRKQIAVSLDNTISHFSYEKLNSRAQEFFLRLAFGDLFFCIVLYRNFYILSTNL